MCVHIFLSMGQFRGHTNQATKWYMDIGCALAYVNDCFLNTCLHQLIQEICIYCKVTEVPMKCVLEKSVSEVAIGLESW